MSGEFDSPYQFKQNNLVVLKHHHGKHIRVYPENTNEVDGHGGIGEYAIWLCELEGNFIKLKNQYSQKYLRIWQNGQQIDADGEGGPFTLFKVHFVEFPNVVKLESERFVGRFIAVNEHGKVHVGEGGHNCVIHFFRQQGAQIEQELRAEEQVIQDQQQVIQLQNQQHQQQYHDPFQLPSYNNLQNTQLDLGVFTAQYKFKRNTEVVILHSQGKFLRINPDAQQFADPHGGTGEYAHWITELEDDNKMLKLKSVMSNKYLRIHEQGNVLDVNGIGGDFCVFRIHEIAGNSVKLESVKFLGRYVAVHPNGVVGVGNGGANCVLTFFHKPLQDDSFIQSGQQQVALQAQMEAMRIAHGQEFKRLEEQRQLELALQQQQQQQQQLQHEQSWQQQDIARRQQEEYQKQQQLMLEAQQAAMQKSLHVEQKIEEQSLSEDARILRAWLESLQMSQYFSVFLQNGFDRVSSVGVITEGDLERMNISLGHRKLLLGAAHLAPFVGKKIALRSMNYNTHVCGNKLDNKKDAIADLGAHKSLDDECVWQCTQIGAGKMTLTNAKHGGYLRMPKIIDKEACTQHEFDDRCELHFVPAIAHPDHVAIFCPNNGNYLSCKEPNLFGHTTLVAKPSIGNQECFSIIIRP